jgi:PncC family amidohydrolase
MTPEGWKILVKTCIEKGITISTAESCTGGHISSIITDIPGASEVYLGGVVAYSNEMKISTLWVDERILIEHGAVSRETAEEMSRGIRDRTGSDIGLSVTGIAGPGGGTEEKPVGTVYISVHLKDDKNITEGFFIEGLSRREFKEEVAERALGMLLGCQYFL